MVTYFSVVTPYNNQQKGKCMANKNGRIPYWMLVQKKEGRVRKDLALFGVAFFVAALLVAGILYFLVGGVQ